MKEDYGTLTCSEVCARSSTTFTYTRIGMRRSQLVIRLSIIVMIAGLLACSRNYKVDFPLQTNDLKGTWTVSLAPEPVRSIAPSNFMSGSKLTLHADGTAHLSLVPVEQLTNFFPFPTSQWSFVSEEAKWYLRDSGGDGRHIWKLRIITSIQGMQLSVGKRTSGLVLIYQPDPDKTEVVEFRRLPTTQK